MSDFTTLEFTLHIGLQGSPKSKPLQF